MGKKYDGAIAKMVHESARELFEIGGISEARMCEYDKLCLVKESRANPRAKFFEVEAEPTEIEHITV